MKLDIIAVGKIRNTPYEDLFAEYHKRLQWPCTVYEIREDDFTKILEKISPQAYVVALDERGKTMKSLAFAEVFRNIQDNGRHNIQFVLGGADGLNDAVRSRADLLLSFGLQTWPHMLARVMLLEQIYRAQQILNGHPYHRE